MTAKELINKKLRGTATYFKDGALEFTPQGQGSPKYEVAQKLGSSAIYKTSGTSAQSFVAHLKVDATDPDPAATLHEQLDKISVKMWPNPVANPTPRGRILLQKEGILCTQNGKRGAIQVSFSIDLHKHVGFMKEFYKPCKNRLGGVLK